MLSLIGCRSASVSEKRFEFARLAMGVEARILLDVDSEAAAARAADAAFAEIERLEQSFSDWREDSELSQLAARAGSGPVAVSADLFAVLARAHEISAATDGAFDVTVGPVVALWRAARKSGSMPDAGELARAARELVGWRLVELDEHSLAVSLAKPGMRLDLGGIGKGYACRRALDVLARAGCERALVQMGGDLACGRAPRGRPGWRVDVGGEQHFVERRCVATSGDTEQHVDVGGVRYSHVVDARTGLGVTARVVVTICAEDGATADALATALGARPEAATAFLARFPGVERWR